MGSRLSMNRCKSAPQGQGESDGFGAFLLSWKRPKRGEHPFRNHFVCFFFVACDFSNHAANAFLMHVTLATRYIARVYETLVVTPLHSQRQEAWMVERSTETGIRFLWNGLASQSLSLSLLNTLL